MAAAVPAFQTTGTMMDNPSILVVARDDGMFDVLPNVSTLVAPPGVANWIDLGYTAITWPNLTMVASKTDVELSDVVAAVDLATGRLCGWDDGCTDDPHGYYSSWLRNEMEIERNGTGYQSSSIIADTEGGDQLVKRQIFRYWAAFRNNGWVRRGNNAVKAAALGALADVVGATSNFVIQSGSQAICTTSAGDKACISWSEGIQAFKTTLASQIISSAQANFHSETLSGENYGSISSANLPYTPSGGHKRDMCNVCISNRGNGCN